MKIAKQLLFLAFMMFLCISVAAADEKVGQATTPGPTVVSQTQYPFTVGSGEYTLNTRIFDFPAGVWSPKHMHTGNGVGIVLDGEITVREKGIEKIYKAGESWTEYPGYVHEVGNAGTAPARVFAVSLVPKGAEFSTIVK